MASKVKIEIELDPKAVKQLEIISKAFGKTMNWLIEYSLKKDLDYYLNYRNNIPELEHYLKSPVINKENLTKLMEEMK